MFLDGMCCFGRAPIVGRSDLHQLLEDATCELLVGSWRERPRCRPKNIDTQSKAPDSEIPPAPAHDFPPILRSLWSATESMDTNFDCHDRWAPPGYQRGRGSLFYSPWLARILHGRTGRVSAPFARAGAHSHQAAR